MDDDNLQSRLTRISTVWTLVAQAGHAPAAGGQPDARLALIQRYQGAAYRYLLAAVRDLDVADELFQEFALRVVQGRFVQADPTKGRFRDYLKSALVHLVADYQRAKHRRSSVADPATLATLAAEQDTVDLDASLVASMRDELLARAWAHLAEIERQGGPSHHSVLRCRAENPSRSSRELAILINAQLHPSKAVTETAFRKSLQRARAAFADYLVADVAHSLDRPTAEQLRQELADLGLLDYCAPALQRLEVPEE